MSHSFLFHVVRSAFDRLLLHLTRLQTYDPYRVYVAASSRDVHAARLVIQTIQDTPGWEVTHDWTDSVLQHGGGPVADDRVAREACARDIEGVRRAECTLLLGGSLSRGRDVESGIAMGVEAPIVMIGAAEGTIWERYPRFHVVEDLPQALETARRLIVRDRTKARLFPRSVRYHGRHEQIQTAAAPRISPHH